MGEGDRLVLRVYTHPACAGCGSAVRDAWEAGREHPEMEVRTVSLERKEGLAEARGKGITTIPTLILARGDEELERWVGTPPPGLIAGAVGRFRDGATAGERG